MSDGKVYFPNRLKRKYSLVPTRLGIDPAQADFSLKDSKGNLIDKRLAGLSVIVARIKKEADSLELTVPERDE